MLLSLSDFGRWALENEGLVFGLGLVPAFIGAYLFGWLFGRLEMRWTPVGVLVLFFGIALALAYTFGPIGDGRWWGIPLLFALFIVMAVGEPGGLKRAGYGYLFQDVS